MFLGRAVLGLITSVAQHHLEPKSYHLSASPSLSSIFSLICLLVITRWLTCFRHHTQVTTLMERSFSIIEKNYSRARCTPTPPRRPDFSLHIIGQHGETSLKIIIAKGTNCLGPVVTNHLELGKSPVTLEALVSSVVIRKEKEEFQSVAFTTGSRFVTLPFFCGGTFSDLQWALEML